MQQRRREAENTWWEDRFQAGALAAAHQSHDRRRRPPNPRHRRVIDDDVIYPTTPDGGDPPALAQSGLEVGVGPTARSAAARPPDKPVRSRTDYGLHRCANGARCRGGDCLRDPSGHPGAALASNGGLHPGRAPRLRAAVRDPDAVSCLHQQPFSAACARAVACPRAVRDPIGNESPACPDGPWLVSKFAREVPRVAHALRCRSTGFPWRPANIYHANARQLAAVTSGLASLAGGAAQLFGGGRVLQSVVRCRNGYLLLIPWETESRWRRWPATGCDIDQIGYEMAVASAGGRRLFQSER